MFLQIDFNKMSATVLHLPSVNFSKRSKSVSQPINVKPVVVDFGRLLKSNSKIFDEVSCCYVRSFTKCFIFQCKNALRSEYLFSKLMEIGR